MFDNPSDEWQRLTGHYHEMFDGELEQLAADFDNLTVAAKEVLRNEMRNRGMGDPAAPRTRPRPLPRPVEDEHFVSEVDPDAGAGGHLETDPADEDTGPHEYTWKTPLCECDSMAEAQGIFKALSRAGVDSWIEQPGSDRVNCIRVVVAADQLEEAKEIAARPIPQQLIDEYDEEVPEFVPPHCPACGTEEPVLESAEPANAWLCEACGSKWSDPIPETDAKEEKSGR